MEQWYCIQSQEAEGEHEEGPGYNTAKLDPIYPSQAESYLNIKCLAIPVMWHFYLLFSKGLL